MRQGGGVPQAVRPRRGRGRPEQTRRRRRESGSLLVVGCRLSVICALLVAGCWFVVPRGERRFAGDAAQRSSNQQRCHENARTTENREPTTASIMLATKSPGS